MAKNELENKLAKLSLYKITLPDVEDQNTIYVLAEYLDIPDVLRILEEGMKGGNSVISSDSSYLKWLKEQGYRIDKIQIESIEGAILTDKKYI